jgi:hypothetical protein
MLILTRRVGETLMVGVEETRLLHCHLERAGLILRRCAGQ